MALLIGSSEFGGKPELKDLRCPPEDVRGLGAVLRQPGCGGFGRVEEIVNADNSEVAFKLNEMLLDAQSGDLVLVYYSGHGKLNRRGQLHLATPNTRPENVETTSLPIVNVRNYMDNCNAQRLVLILDCCFSGRVGDAFMKSSIGDNLQAAFENTARGVYIITASTGIESAIEKDGDRYSVFTGPLIHGLATGKADVDHNGWVDMDELYSYLSSEVQKANKQTPMRWNLSSIEEIRIARNPSYEDRPMPADRWTSLLDFGREEPIARDVLVDALGFLEGRSQPFNVSRAGELIDLVVKGNVGPRAFESEWRDAAERHATTDDARLRVLAIDGTGIRTVLPALVLAELERRTGRLTCELFDVIAATSFGALLVLALTVPRPGSDTPMSAADFVGVLTELGPRLFRSSLAAQVRGTGGLTAPEYHQEAMLDLAGELFEDWRLSQVEGVELFLSAYEIERQTPFYFLSRRAREDRVNDFYVRDVAIAATAIPGFFPPVVLEGLDSRARYALVDGSLFASNPAMTGYAEARRARPEAPEPLVLSLGSGDLVRPIPAEEAQEWGLVHWAAPLFGMAANGASKQVDDQLVQLLGSKSYTRIQHSLRTASGALDDAGVENLERLGQDARDTIAGHDAILVELCSSLLSPPPPTGSRP